MSSEPPRSDFASISRFLRPPCVLRSQTEQADELPESGTREHDVPFVLHRAPWVGFAHITVVLAHHVTLMCACRDVVLLTLAWSWQLMFRVCAPARAGLLCALRVLFVHLLHLVSFATWCQMDTKRRVSSRAVQAGIELLTSLVTCLVRRNRAIQISGADLLCGSCAVRVVPKSRPRASWPRACRGR